MATSKVSLLLGLSETFASGQSPELKGAGEDSMGYRKANTTAILGHHLILRIGHAFFPFHLPFGLSYLNGGNIAATKLGVALGPKASLILWSTVPL